VRAAHEQPYVRAYHNTTQSATNGVNLILALNSERYDQAFGSASTMHDTVTNNSRLTCRYAGVYMIVANVEWATSTTGIRLVEIVLNAGLTAIGRTRSVMAGTTDPTTQIATAIYPLAVNDYVQTQVFQNSGGGLNVVSSANYSPEFSMVRVA
jgi:hypothetical protein